MKKTEVTRQHEEIDYTKHD